MEVIARTAILMKPAWLTAGYGEVGAGFRKVALRADLLASANWIGLAVQLLTTVGKGYL